MNYFHPISNFINIAIIISIITFLENFSIILFNHYYLFYQNYYYLNISCASYKYLFLNSRYYFKSPNSKNLKAIKTIAIINF
jgi:hypothetical protein